MSKTTTRYQTTRSTVVTMFPGSRRNKNGGGTPPSRRPILELLTPDETPEKYVIIDGVMPLAMAKALKTMFDLIAR